MKIARVLGLPLMAASLAWPAGAAPVADTPDGFLRHVYAQYAPGKKTVAFVYPDAAPMVDASLLALLRHDEQMSKGEVGALDYDPVCQCQDWGPFKLISVRIVSSAQARAVADATFENGSGRDAAPETVRFDLVRTSEGWRIHDVHSKEAPSLQATLRTAKY
jgi:hypothetical protein